jgi:hypothetical protein
MLKHWFDLPDYLIDSGVGDNVRIIIKKQLLLFYIQFHAENTRRITHRLGKNFQTRLVTVHAAFFRAQR